MCNINIRVRLPCLEQVVSTHMYTNMIHTQTHMHTKTHIYSPKNDTHTHTHTPVYDYVKRKLSHSYNMGLILSFCLHFYRW